MYIDVLMKIIIFDMGSQFLNPVKRQLLLHIIIIIIIDTTATFEPRSSSEAPASCSYFSQSGH